jgi:hypothetical protein
MCLHLVGSLSYLESSKLINQDARRARIPPWLMLLDKLDPNAA